MRSFKQFIYEDDGREIYAKQLGAVPDFTPDLAGKNYKVGDVTFSAQQGLGSVPNAADPYYFGFVAMMKPTTFHSVVLPYDEEREETAGKLVELLKQGYACGIPFLQVSLKQWIDDQGPPKVVGHEGRARMIAVKSINGDQAVPVHIYLAGGMRGRDIDKDILAALKARLQIEGGTRVVNSPYEQVYVKGAAA